MFEKKYIGINAFLIIIVFGLLFFPKYSIGNDNAIKLFKQKKYNEALPMFKEEYKASPTSPAVCYYYGICLVETRQLGYLAETCLKIAIEGNEPYDANFYLAKHYHATNKFRMATTYYRQFRENATRKEIKFFNVDQLIDQCQSSINPFFLPQTDNFVADSISNPIEQIDSLSDLQTPIAPIAEEKKELVVPSQLTEDPINFILTSDIYYLRFSQFRTYDGKLNFIDGWNNADSLKQLLAITDSLRTEYSKTISTETKTEIANKVVGLENLIRKKKTLTDNYYYKANEFELTYWDKAPENEKWRLIAENDSIKNADEMKKIVLAAPVEITTDTIEINDSISADPTSTEPIEAIVEPQKTNMVVFKVQIGKYNTELPESAKKLFKKISALRKVDQYTDEKNFTVYTIGELTNIKDAVKLQNQIRQESVKDAFVIAIKDGKRIPLNEALESTK